MILAMPYITPTGKERDMELKKVLDSFSSDFLHSLKRVRHDLQDYQTPENRLAVVKYLFHDICINCGEDTNTTPPHTCD